MASDTENTLQVSEDHELGSQSLMTVFEEGLNLYNNLGKIDEPTNSPNVQINVNKAIRTFEDCTRLVSMAGIFSTNEDVEEIPTENLRYLLLPALLGSLCLKLTSRNRKDITEVAEAYFKDYLQRCNNYGLSDYKFKTSESSESKSDDGKSSSNKSEFEDIRGSINTRAGKIQRFREQKELQAKLADLKSNMSNENVDEEIKRNYFLTMIKLFIYEAVDELGSIEAEKQILEHMANLNRDEMPKPKRPPPQPLKPVIITKDDVQKAVFGAGYPSLPVMSVEEFYEKRVRDGIFPGPNAAPNSGTYSLQDSTGAAAELRDEAEQELKEKLEEEEDPDLLEQMRDRDEFKDDHRRGWGNRMNRS